MLYDVSSNSKTSTSVSYDTFHKDMLIALSPNGGAFEADGRGSFDEIELRLTTEQADRLQTAIAQQLQDADYQVNGLPVDVALKSEETKMVKVLERDGEGAPLYTWVDGVGVVS